MAKKKLFKNKIPDNCGGGTVFYVRDLLSHCACNEVIHNCTYNIFKTEIKRNNITINYFIYGYSVTDECR